MTRQSVATRVVTIISKEFDLVRSADEPADSAKSLLRVANLLVERAALDDALPDRRRDTSPADIDCLVTLELGPQSTQSAVGGTNSLDVLDGDDSASFESASPPSLTEEDVVAAFRRGAPEHRVDAVKDLRRISGGFSKETIRAAVIDEGHRETDVVIRKVSPGRRTDGLRLEYDIVALVASAGIPAPVPIWYLDDCLGTPAFAATGLPGGLLGNVWGWTEHPAEVTVHDLGAAMGQLHSLDATPVGSAPLPPLRTRQDHMAAVRERRDVVEAIWARGDDAFRPVFALVLDWLEEHVPADSETQVLVHGDFGLHNILFSDGRLSGLLDWERAHLGNPAEDLAYLKPSLDQIGGWETFLSGYLEAGGPPPSTRDVDYFTVWQDLWRAVSSYRVRDKFLTDPSQLADAVSGLLLTPRFLARAALRVGDDTKD